MSASMWIIEYASGESSTTAGKTFPVDAGSERTLATWFQCVGPGTVVVACEGGQVFTRHAVGGEVYKGSFTALTSTTCQYLVMGNGAAPPAIPQGTTGAGVTIADAGNFTAQTTVEGALQEIYQDLESTKGVIPLNVTGGFLVAGTPLAAFADAEGATPGIDVTNTKGTGARWNDHATPTAIWLPAVFVPADFDASHAPVLKVLAAKTGATIGDATTFLVVCQQQVVGALLDGSADLGGTTGAMTGNATSKTVQQVSLTLAVAAASPSTLSMSIKPANGTLGTDDVTVFAAWIEYTRKLRTS